MRAEKFTELAKDAKWFATMFQLRKLMLRVKCFLLREGSILQRCSLCENTVRGEALVF